MQAPGALLEMGTLAVHRFTTRHSRDQIISDAPEGLVKIGQHGMPIKLTEKDRAPQGRLTFRRPSGTQTLSVGITGNELPAYFQFAPPGHVFGISSGIFAGKHNFCGQQHNACGTLDRQPTIGQ